MRRFLKVILLGGFTVVLGMAALPFVLDAILPAQIQKHLAMVTSVDKVRTSWFRPLVIERMSLQSEPNMPIEVDTVTLDKTLVDLIPLAFLNPEQASLLVHLSGKLGAEAAPVSMHLDLDVGLAKLKALLKKEPLSQATLGEVVHKMNCGVDINRISVPFLNEIGFKSDLGFKANLIFADKKLSLGHTQLRLYPGKYRNFSDEYEFAGSA